MPRPLNRNSFQRLLLFIIGAAGLYYLLLLPRFPVGTYLDDARYILAAQSLLQGHYVNLEVPGEIPTNYPMPGLPLALAPFVALFQPHWSVLKIVPWTLTLGSIALLGRLYKKVLTRGFLAGVLILFAFNPTTAAFSSLVMTESLFTFLILLIFTLTFLEGPLKRRTLDIAVGALLGWASWIRGEGFLLTLSIVAGLFQSGQTRRLRPILGTALPLSALLWIRNRYSVGAGKGYQGFFSDLWVGWQGSDFGDLGSRMGETLHGFVCESLFPVPGAWPAPWVWLICGAAFLAVFLGIWGAIVRWRDTRMAPGLPLSMTIFFVPYLGALLLWPFRDIRFFLPLLPFAFFWILTGCQEAGHRIRKPGLYVGLLLGLQGVLYGIHAQSAFRESRNPPLENQLPQQTFEWIRNHVPAKAVVLTAQPPLIRLYTDRYAFRGGEAATAEEFETRLRQNAIEFVLFARALPTAGNVPWRTFTLDQWIQRYHWVQKSPRTFGLIYENGPEATRLYQVKPRKP